VPLVVWEADAVKDGDCVLERDTVTLGVNDWDDVDDWLGVGLPDDEALGVPVWDGDPVRLEDRV